MSLLGLFVEVDDFVQKFEGWAAQQQLPGKAKRGPEPSLSVSEVMTLVNHFHIVPALAGAQWPYTQEGYRDFKHYYQKHVCKHLAAEFPGLVCYGRFVERMSTVLLPLCAYLQRRFGRCNGTAFIDSTPLAICHNRRINRNKVFKELAARGKTSMGWFYGFKLHLIVNEVGERLAVHLTPGNTDDRNPLEDMSKHLCGKLFGDKGYLSKAMSEKLLERGLELITSLRKNLKAKLMPLADRLLLRKRFIIETINDQLKNISQIEHTRVLDKTAPSGPVRHRSPTNFAVNLIAGLIAYTHQSKKPSIRLPKESAQLPALI